MLSFSRAVLTKVVVIHHGQKFKRITGLLELTAVFIFRIENRKSLRVIVMDSVVVSIVETGLSADGKFLEVSKKCRRVE